MGGPSSQIKTLHTRTESANKNGTDKFGGTNYNSNPPSTIAEEHDPITLGSEEANLESEEIKLPKKRSLKDMITQVPKSNSEYP